MDYELLHHAGAATLVAAGTDSQPKAPQVKIGVDVHLAFFVAVVQQDHATPGAPRRFAPEAFVPWVRTLLRAGREVHVVYEACGFGFGLHRALLGAGAACYVICPQALDESHSGVKTDGRDAHTLCLRLDRYVQGNRRALAVNRREVSSYTGLCPGEHSSGGKRKQGHVTKHGNPRLRAALVEPSGARPTADEGGCPEGAAEGWRGGIIRLGHVPLHTTE